MDGTYRSGMAKGAIGDPEARRETDRLIQIVEMLNSSLELDQVLAKIADWVKENVGYDTFGILLLQDLGQELQFRFGAGYPEDIIEHWRFGMGQGIVGMAAQTGKPIYLGEAKSV